MMSERKPLNLDELYGTARPVIVVWGGKRYELHRPEALTPVEYSRWMKLQKKLGMMEAFEAEEMSEEQAKELSEAIAMVLSLFSPELAAVKLPFAAQVRVLQHYTAEVFETEQSGNGSKNPIGA